MLDGTHKWNGIWLFSFDRHCPGIGTVGGRKSCKQQSCSTLQTDVITEFFGEFQGYFVRGKGSIHNAKRLRYEFSALFGDVQGKRRNISRQHCGLEDQPVGLSEKSLASSPYRIRIRFEFEALAFGQVSQERGLFGIWTGAQSYIKMEVMGCASQLEAFRSKWLAAMACITGWSLITSAAETV